MGRSGRSLPADEIVTGERLQALAEAILIPDALARRHAGAPLGSPRAVAFHQHADLAGADLARAARAASLSIYSPALALFQQHVWPRLDGRGYVLISHNGDAEVGADQLDWIESEGDKLGHWFAQNALVEHPKLSPLPIGVANAMWEHGDVDALSAVAERMRPTEPTRLLHARFDAGTHPDRARAHEAVRRALPEVAAADRAPTYRDYLEDLARHRFCACPRGNGTDTHRLWECHYLGVVPVVERSPHTDMWARRGVAMVALDDWSELSTERLEAEPRRPRPEAADVARLSHHAQLVRAAERRRTAEPVHP
jgi:hypothetical protein